MTSWSDLSGEMQRFPLDADTADRMLAGSVQPEDAPPGYAAVASLLAAARAEPAPAVPELSARAVARLARVVRSSTFVPPASSPRRSLMPRLKLATALAGAALLATAALAAAGSLPGAAQDIASEMLAKVGVTVPGPNSNAGTHPDERGQSGARPEQAGEGQGAEISDLATSTELEGVAKGAAVSSLASGDKSQAGQHGQGAEAVGAPVATPNEGGTGTAAEASDGTSATGSATADGASGGHSSAGSANSGR